MDAARSEEVLDRRMTTEKCLILTCATEAVWLTPNVRANRPAEAGGVSLARDSGEAAARQAYAACRSWSG